MHAKHSRVFVPATNAVYDLEWLTGTPGGQAVLARGHRNQQQHRLRCACHAAQARQPELVVRLLHKRYYIARMPETGHLHDRYRCPMFSEDPSHSGRSEYEGALRYRGEVVDVKVAFPLGAAAPRPGKPVVPRLGELGRTRRGSMGLAGLLSLLWTQAGLNSWTPGTVLPWVRVQSKLLEASADIFLGKRRLRDHLFVQAGAGEHFLPKPSVEQADWHDYKLVLFKVSSTIKTPNGGAYFKSTSGDAILVKQDVLATIKRSYARPMQYLEAEAGHLQSGRLGVVCLALAHWKVVRGAPCLSVLQAALLMTNWRSIPVESAYELEIADLLVAQERRFTKPMRFDAAAEVVFPDFVLSDAGADAIPMEVYGVSGNADYEARKLQKRALYQASGKPFWEWTPPDPIPPLLPKRMF